MALKPVYMIEGRRWLPIGRAAKLVGTNAATIKTWMADGTLDWRQLREYSSTLLVAEEDIIRLRAERGALERETAMRAAAATRTMAETGRSQRARPPERSAARRFGAFSPSWDPARLPLPISGRDKPDPNRP